MERLTFKVEDGNYIENPERVNGKIVGTRSCLKKLGELEDLEEQVKDFLTEAGMKIIKISDDYTDNEIDNDSKRVVIVAQK